jgi:hypothetical protein
VVDQFFIIFCNKIRAYSIDVLSIPAYSSSNIYVYIILVTFGTDILSSETTSLVSATCIDFLPQITAD